MPANPMEKEYQVREWEKVESSLDLDVRALTLFESYGVCNSDSMRAEDFYSRQRLPKLLLDYELIAMGEEPLSGTVIMIAGDGRFVVGVFVPCANGMPEIPTVSVNYYIEKEKS